MNLHRWSMTGLAVVAAAGLSVFAGCDQQPSQTYEIPDTDTTQTPGTRSTPQTPGTSGNPGTQGDTDREVGDVGTMGTTRDQGMIGSENDANAPADTGGDMNQ